MAVIVPYTAASHRGTGYGRKRKGSRQLAHRVAGVVGPPPYIRIAATDTIGHIGSLILIGKCLIGKCIFCLSLLKTYTGINRGPVWIRGECGTGKVALNLKVVIVRKVLQTGIIHNPGKYSMA